jgi:hypothetical protein
MSTGQSSHIHPTFVIGGCAAHEAVGRSFGGLAIGFAGCLCLYPGGHQRRDDYVARVLSQPKARTRNAEALRDAVRELVDLVTGELRTITSPLDGRPRHFAALALARTARLVAAREALRSSGFEDVSELPLRQITEHVALGFYALYGGEEAYEHIRGAHVYDLGLLDTGGEPDPLVEAWTGPRDRLKWQDLMINVVPKLLQHLGDATAEPAFQRLDNQIYRGQSLLVSHAGVGTLSRHMTHPDDTTRGVEPTGYTVEDGTGAIVMGGALLALLAVYVFWAFDRDITGIVQLNERLQTVDLELLPDEQR